MQSTRNAMRFSRIKLGGIFAMVSIALLAAVFLGSPKPAESFTAPVVRVVPEVSMAGWPGGTVQEKPQNQTVDPGSLQIWDPNGKGAFCPLKNTNVQADVAGFGARVTVVQTFTNPSKSPIEAIYTFPLPADAAVDRMRFAIGTRIVEGEIKRRDEARRIYNAAKNAGQATALLDQERPNIFTQSVANILPGQDVQVEISYVQIVKYVDDWFEFNFPMVVGPRFLGNAPDPGKIAPPIVAEGKRTGAGISLNVNLDAGGPLEEVQSVLHEITSRNVAKGKMQVQLAKKDEIPNRDFILRYKLAGAGVRDAFFTHADPKKGGFFTLVLLPPQRVQRKDIAPKEMIFVLDQSGSQSGFPIEKSKELMRRMLNIMRPDDTFNVMGFSSSLNKLWAQALPNSGENRKTALAFIDGLQANGGTQLQLAIDDAMKSPLDKGRRRVIVFNTDGYVGDEFNILDSIQKSVGNTRIFTFGIGNGVNRFLIDSMSVEGGGASEIVTLNANADSAVNNFAERLNSPVLTDIKVSVDGVPVEDVLPRVIPDVYAQTPVVIKGRYTNPGKARVRISGYVGGEPWSRDLDVEFPATDKEGSAVASIWAREKVDDLMRSNWLSAYRAQMNPQNGETKPDTVEEQVVALSLKYGIMTQFTSFVAVESRVINVGGQQVTVRVPVEMADGVSYEGIFDSYERKEMALGRTRGAGSYAYGGGGGGFGGAAPPMTAASKGVSTLRGGYMLDGDAGNTLSQVNPTTFSKDIDKWKDEEVAGLSVLTDEQEKPLLKDLSPAQLARYLRLTRLDQALWKNKDGKVSIQIWVKKWPSTVDTEVQKLGGKVLLSDASLKAVFATVDAKDLGAIAALPGVAKVLPLKG